MQRLGCEASSRDAPRRPPRGPRRRGPCEPAPEPDRDVHRVRGEQRKHDRVLLEAHDGRHLARPCSTPASSIPGYLARTASTARWWSTSQAREQEAGLRRRSSEGRIALREDGLERGLEVDVVAVPDRHPEHARSVARRARAGSIRRGRTGSGRDPGSGGRSGSPARGSGRPASPPRRRARTARP